MFALPTRNCSFTQTSNSRKQQLYQGLLKTFLVQESPRTPGPAPRPLMRLDIRRAGRLGMHAGGQLGPALPPGDRLQGSGRRCGPASPEPRPRAAWLPGAVHSDSFSFASAVELVTGDRHDEPCGRRRRASCGWGAEVDRSGFQPRGPPTCRSSWDQGQGFVWASFRFNCGIPGSIATVSLSPTARRRRTPWHRGQGEPLCPVSVLCEMWVWQS